MFHICQAWILMSVTCEHKWLCTYVYPVIVYNILKQFQPWKNPWTRSSDRDVWHLSPGFYLRCLCFSWKSLMNVTRRCVSSTVTALYRDTLMPPTDLYVKKGIRHSYDLLCFSFMNLLCFYCYSLHYLIA